MPLSDEKMVDDIRMAFPLRTVRIRSSYMTGNVRWMGVLAFLILGAPKLRVMIGPAPLYAIDALIGYLLVSTQQIAPGKKFVADKALSGCVTAYLFFVWVGELHGLIIYGSLLESVYLAGEFTLGISLFFIMPKLLDSGDAMARVLQGIVAGLICASMVTILYSLSPTRPLVMNTVLGFKFLVPEAESLARKTLYYGGMAEAMRGQSLIGTSTITTGFLGTMWAFAFLGSNWPGIGERWRMAANIAAIVTPVAMLMTYGRAAWLTVIVLGGMSLIFGFAKSRRNIIILIFGLGMVVFKLGWQSDLFMVDRVLITTEMAIDNPYEEESFAQRLKSYTQPFSHLVRHPLWLITGAGRVGQKLSQRGDLVARLMDDAGLSKHSGFGMAYYCYGLLAAVTHALIMINGLMLILKRLRHPPLKAASLYKLAWQVFLLAWIGLLFWWLPGHAMIGEARGVILFFFFYGLMMACDRALGEQKESGESDEAAGRHLII